MAANEMTDNEIIKFIEHAINSAKGEDGFKEIYWEKLEYILDLINHQKAENERLNIELQSMRSAANSYKMHYEKAQIEIDRLQKNIDGLNIFTTNHMKVIRLQAIKEFAEKINEYRNICPMNGKEYICMDIQEINNLVKEMTEVNKNDRA